MARRKKTNARLIMAVLGMILICLIGAWIMPSLTDPHRAKPRLNVAEYLAEPRSFSRNVYFLEGEITDRIAATDKGAVFALTTTGAETIAVFVPTRAFPSHNIEKGQRLNIDVEISDSGAVVAKTVTKK